MSGRWWIKMLHFVLCILESVLSWFHWYWWQIDSRSRYSAAHHHAISMESQLTSKTWTKPPGSKIRKTNTFLVHAHGDAPAASLYLNGNQGKQTKVQPTQILPYYHYFTGYALSFITGEIDIVADAKGPQCRNSAYEGMLYRSGPP